VAQDTAKLPAGLPAQAARLQDPDGECEEKPAGEVVSLDRFRKR